ncbi:MAG: hypothetical protein HY273_16590 [Gammaproteobacteria bacterium]|nr:hypothetical protein [Gammaproteobacteria bacterium]
MLLVRSTVAAFATIIFCVLLPPVTGSARDIYFSPQCGSCHTTAAPTCNGCHVHGTHPDYLAGAVGTLNLKAATDKTAYVEGDPILVMIEGGHMADFKGWVGVRVYDSSGAEVTRKQTQLGCSPYPTQFGNKCDLPMKLSVPAQLGWTKLYMSWAGNQYDRTTGAAYGTLLGNTFGAGRRPLKDDSGNAVANHIEEIVMTGTFAVTPAPPQPVSTPTPAPNQNPGGGSTGTSSTPNAKQDAGAGALDPSFVIVFLLPGLFCIARCKTTKARPD